MSSKLHGLVWEGCGPSGMIISRIAVLARLADYSNDEGYSWPAVDTIREQVGAKSKNTVRAAIKELEKAGWLVVKERKSGGRNMSNAYQLDVEKIEQAAESARKKKRGVPKSDPSKNDPSKSDSSKFDGSNNFTLGGQNLVGEGSTVDPDPLRDLITDPSKKNTSVQPPSAAGRDDKISEEIHVTDQAILVLKHLNQVTGAKYTTAKATLENIRARLVDGHTVEELKTVVEFMANRWLGTEWSKHLTPPTIFNPAKFPANLLGAQAWEKSGRAAVAQRAEPVNTVERDDAFKRLVANPGKPRNRIEELAKRAAGKAGLGRINETIARNSWKSIWTEAVKNAAEENQQESA